ncbi:MAG: RluA family pseudouridine synthase [Verrucomicrobia bacterium]|nr:RluA family pseudouridine synthase [Verrucomicrobiota bacterium]
MAMPADFEVTESSGLLQFLLARMPEKSRTSVKSLLNHRLVSVNGEIITQFNHALRSGERVAIRRVGEAETPPSRRLKIVYEDSHLIVVEKRAGLLSMATDRERDMTAYSLLSEHVKKARPGNRIFIVHRLDRETSGLMMFAKSQAVQQALQKAWSEAVLERTYVAVVEGQVTKTAGSVTSWLKENKALVMRSSQNPQDGQKATTHFRLLQSNTRYSLLELSLETGRKNPIRVHMQDLGHSVIGDPKYGATQDPIHRLGLHARVLAFRHPVTGGLLRFESPIPQEFSCLFQRP